ncbi:Glycine cleavage system regulatory protein [endosymbiont of Ridgeia piscesae]|jgi:glycine cleavage system transcriptional repressor|uniref:Glycine cleavage system regulatory protein n=1 Tax=endosymbiont of Ridgeia piscesae TaxID=54398 RepID=A0A0T5YWU4_9GAMM|nr:ACT domain-containing protein [endosymbiont of Ridgeia piscesae]KRT55099.1 Glycine cleavage system regulatory protein [endosymbiont of Ridgeia piscesae]
MQWQMLTLVGEDRAGIVAQVTDALFKGGCSLGEASMLRLGGNFSVMLMVRGDQQSVEGLIAPVAEALGLRFHLDPIHGGLHQHRVPNYQVRVVGADRAGIVAQVTGALAEAGFNILELESDVAGSEADPVYIMTIQGFAETTLEQLQAALARLGDEAIEVNISPIETLIG